MRWLMKRNTLCPCFHVLITAVFIVANTASATFTALPAIPKSGDNLNAFVPTGWKIMEQVKEI